MTLVQLGFVDKNSKGGLTKIGGAPELLFQPQCLKDFMYCECKRKMCLLVQLETPDISYERVMYIFVCKEAYCQENPTEKRGFVCISLQKIHKEIKEFVSPCVVCGDASSSVCTRCKKVYYCSSTCQAEDWRERIHKKYCEEISDNKIDMPTYKSLLAESYIDETFPECGISTLEKECADVEKIEEPTDMEEDTMEKNRHFLHYLENIRDSPSQIIRYYRLGGNESQEPLWVSERGIIDHESIPRCGCGQKRFLELQIMSQIISMLDIVPKSKLYHMEWGTIVVWSCKSMCQEVRREFVTTQYI